MMLLLLLLMGESYSDRLDEIQRSLMTPEEQARTDRHNRMINWFILGLIVTLLIALCVYVMLNQSY